MIYIEDVEKAFDEANKLSCRPNRDMFPVYSEGDVIDEDKSVKWNREEIQRLNQLRADEIRRLTGLRGKAFQGAHQLAVDYIKQETGLNDAQANVLDNYVWERWHAYGDDYINQLDETVDMFNEIVKKRNS